MEASTFDDIKRDSIRNKKLATNLNYSIQNHSSQDTIDILSNGFKMRSNNNHNINDDLFT